MTANTYVHAIESLQDDAADQIDALLRTVVNKAIAINSGTSVPHGHPDNEKTPWTQGFIGSANGNRTRLSALKGQRPNR